MSSVFTSAVALLFISAVKRSLSQLVNALTSTALKKKPLEWQQRTAQLMQRLLGVGVPVAALADVVGF